MNTLKFSVPKNAAIKLATSHAIAFFIFFILITYASTFVQIKIDGEFNLKYPRYFVIAFALSLIIPFGLSSILIYGILAEHVLTLKIWMTIIIAYAMIVFIATFGSGIFLLKNTIHTIAGYCLICISVILCASIGGSVLVIKRYISSLQIKEVFL